MATPIPPRNRQDFEIAIICALPLEAKAVIALFDRDWEAEGTRYGKAPGDPNAYAAGVIGEHNVVVAHMPGMMNVPATSIAAGLRASFECIKLALVVGICGGVPYGPRHKGEIFLGDVVISQSLIQYDFRKQNSKVGERRDTLGDGRGRLPLEIRSMLAKLQTDYHQGRLQNSTNHHLEELQRKIPQATYPGREADRLFEPSYIHKHRDRSICAVCGDEDGTGTCEGALRTTCRGLGCQGDRAISRNRPMEYQEPMEAEAPLSSIHIGKMGSGDRVMKSGLHRDAIANEYGIIAFEMEGAGVWDHFPSIVIKGVCDYADSHKNNQWRQYAAATAAACTRALLNGWDSGKEMMEPGQSSVYSSQYSVLFRA